jgi:hypothetical protein
MAGGRTVILWRTFVGIFLIFVSTSGVATARTGVDAMAAQRAIVSAADARDRAKLDAAMSAEFVLLYGLIEGNDVRWGETDRERVLKRWTKVTPGALPTLISQQRAVVVGHSATVFACVADRVTRADGTIEQGFSRVSDSFTWTRRRWLWIASMEVQVGACPS